MAIYNESDKSKWTKDGRHWYFKTYYKGLDGKEKHKQSKMFKTKKEAEFEELKFKTQKRNPALVKFSFISSKYFEHLYSVRKESTVYSYENAFNKQIKPYFNDFYLNDINTQVINNWKSIMLKNGLSVAYCNKLHNILKGIFDFAIKNYDFKDNPLILVGRFEKVDEDVKDDKKKLKYITYDEFNKFISVIDDELFKTYFTFLYLTGVRKGESQSLLWSDVDFKKNEITINKTLSVKTKEQYKITNTKNYINRKIKMSKALKDSLLNYKKNMMKYKDFKESWFVFGNTRFLASTTIDTHKHKYFELANIPEITCHQFRHSHVSLLINQYLKSGQTDTTKFFLMMSDRMGHSVKVMQETYMHLFPTVQNEIVDLLDNL